MNNFAFGDDVQIFAFGGCGFKKRSGFVYGTGVSFSIKDSRRGCCKVEIVNINVKVLFALHPLNQIGEPCFLRATSSLQFVCLLHGTMKKTWAKKDMGPMQKTCNMYV